MIAVKQEKLNMKLYIIFIIIYNIQMRHFYILNITKKLPDLLKLLLIFSLPEDCCQRSPYFLKITSRYVDVILNLNDIDLGRLAKII